MSWSADRLVYWARDPKTSGDIWSVSVNETGDGNKPEAILQTQADERNPQVSPDGKWIAYSSNETGRSEVYVRPFPQGSGRIQVSVNGGVYAALAPRRAGTVLHEPRGSGLDDGVRDPGERQLGSEGGSTHACSNRFSQVALTTGASPIRTRCRLTACDYLIPQFESVIAGFGPTVGPAAFPTALAFAVPAVTADRRAATAPASSGAAPITVVLNWPGPLRP